MQTFNYSARNPITGDQVKAQVEAENEIAAASLIKKEGLVPIDIKSTSKTAGFLKFLNRVRAKDKILFSRQLATLLNAGLPLIQALRSTADQTESRPLQVIINSLVTRIEGGSSLSKALADHKDVFNEIFINLVAAGETSGTLDKALERLATQQEKDADILGKIKSAFAYPIIILIVMGVVVGFMTVKVLPAVGNLYAQLPGTHLPIETAILLKFSHFLSHDWYLAILIGIVVIVFLRWWSKTELGKKAFDKAKMKAWPIGPLMMKVYMARFSRTATTLVSSGVPLLQVLEITARAVDNVYISNSLHKAIEKVKGGKALSDSITGDSNFLPLVPNMLRIGEQSGTIEQMLERVADYYEKEVDNEVKTISSLMEPLLMVILGIVAFILVAAVLLPIYSLAGNNALTSAF